MTRFISKALVMLGAGTLLAACGQPDTLFFVRNQDADMPVLVRGNLASGKMVLYVHGGPGSNGLTASTREGWQQIERSYAVAYWEQRGSGSSRGNATPDQFTMKQFSEDLDGVVDTLHRKYPNQRLILLGHSWGGALGSAYLLDAGHQAKIAGWIEVDGSHSVVEGNQRSWQTIKDVAPQHIASGPNADLWRKALAWHEQNPLSKEGFATHIGLVGQLEEELAPPRPHDPMANPRLGIATPYSPFTSAANQGNMFEHFVKSDAFMSLDLTSQLGNIKIPSLVLWGRQDMRLPVEMATGAFNALGTPAASKSMQVFEHSAHSPQDTEPEAFAAAVTSFVRSL
ncbi:MAG TPA: alpha/beta hydrolase [Stenomitos sp.]